MDLVKHGALVHDCDMLRALAQEVWSPTPWSIATLEGHSVRIAEFQDSKARLLKGCALNKHVKFAFPSSEHSSMEILDPIHSYVCGSMSSISLVGNIYWCFSKKP